jgi:hypothetical protein
MSGASFTEGVVQHEVEGISVKVFSPAKTVADCFKFRGKVGLSVAMEALRDYVRSSAGPIDALWHYAGICRVQTVIRPYMEALV